MADQVLPVVLSFLIFLYDILGALPLNQLMMNLEQISKLRGVSQLTVSCGVNGDPDVSSGMRERVMQVVKR